MKIDWGYIANWLKQKLSQFLKSKIMGFVTPYLVGIFGWFTPLVSWVVGLGTDFVAKLADWAGYRVASDADNHIDAVKYERDKEEFNKNPTEENKQKAKDAFDDLLDARGKK